MNTYVSDYNSQTIVETPLHPQNVIVWFQQDGATCHTANETINLLEGNFGERIISRHGPVARFSRSCDLKPQVVEN